MYITFAYAGSAFVWQSARGLLTQVRTIACKKTPPLASRKGGVPRCEAFTIFDSWLARPSAPIPLPCCRPVCRRSGLRHVRLAGRCSRAATGREARKPLHTWPGSDLRHGRLVPSGHRAPLWHLGREDAFVCSSSSPLVLACPTRRGPCAR